MRPWAEKYVGLPFIDGGRDWKGVDCWGLVRLVLAYERKIILPSYGEISAMELIKVAGVIASESSREPWHIVTDVAAFDVVVMYGRRTPIHVGIMADSLHVLHIEEATSAVLIDIKHPSVAFRLFKYFRHRDLLNACAA